MGDGEDLLERVPIYPADGRVPAQGLDEASITFGGLKEELMLSW